MVTFKKIVRTQNNLKCTIAQLISIVDNRCCIFCFLLYLISDTRKNYCGLIHITNLRYRWGSFWFVLNSTIHPLRSTARVLPARDLTGTDFLATGDKTFHRSFTPIEHSLSKNRTGIKDNLLHTTHKIKTNVT